MSNEGDSNNANTNNNTNNNTNTIHTPTTNHTTNPTSAHVVVGGVAGGGGGVNTTDQQQQQQQVLIATTDPAAAMMQLVNQTKPLTTTTTSTFPMDSGEGRGVDVGDGNGVSGEDLEEDDSMLKNGDDILTSPTSGILPLDKKKRLCRHPGCSKVIKSQGHCQRHGAKAKRCKVEGCDKQAQGTHDGMCKRHWKAAHFPGALSSSATGSNNNSNNNNNNASTANGSINGMDDKGEDSLLPPPPEGDSVYDDILPQSISYRPNMIHKNMQQQQQQQLQHVSMASTDMDGSSNSGGEQQQPQQQQPHKMEDDDGSPNPTTTTTTATTTTVDGSPAIPPGVSVMPLVELLRNGLSKEPGWHRNAERRARGLFPVTNLGVQLEPWERQLALVEILLLSGGTPFASFKDLAHAWGREKGFHHVLASSVCERRGEVERKRRSDAGKTLTEEQRENFRTKLKRARNSNTNHNNNNNTNHNNNNNTTNNNNNNNTTTTTTHASNNTNHETTNGNNGNATATTNPLTQQPQQAQPSYRENDTTSVFV